MAYRASQTLLSYDSGGRNVYHAALMAQVTNRPRTALRILPLRLRDTTEFSRTFPTWAEIEAWAHHTLGEHEAELAALRAWRLVLPDDPLIREHEAGALVALGRVGLVSLLADSALLVPPDGWYYPNVGLIPGIIALETRAHGHAALAPALLDKALTWYAARTTDPSATLRARFEHAQVLSWAGRDQEAEAQLQSLIIAAPDSVRYLGQLGVVAVRLGHAGLASRMDRQLAAPSLPI